MHGSNYTKTNRYAYKTSVLNLTLAALIYFFQLCPLFIYFLRITGQFGFMCPKITHGDPIKKRRTAATTTTTTKNSHAKEKSQYRHGMLTEHRLPKLEH